MLIDWFTVGAQALNFIILVWLMKRFLYKPILDAIDARERRIATELAEADKKEAAAQSDRDELRQKNEAFDQQRVALLAKATTDADAERRQLLDSARAAADALTAAHRQTMAGDAKNVNRDLRKRVQAEVFAVARRTLADLATAELEASVCELFIVRLQALEGPAKEDLAAALKASHSGALVRTAFELPTAQRAAVQRAVNDTFAISAALHYEVVPELVSGIELSTHGQKFAWSIANYLALLEQGVNDLLTPDAKLDPVPAVPVPKIAVESTPRPARSAA